MAIQPGSHNTIPVSSRPGCHAGGSTAKIPSPWP